MTEKFEIYPVLKNEKASDVKQSIAKELEKSWFELDAAYFSLFPKDEMDEEFLADSLEFEKASQQGVNKTEHKGFYAVYIERM